MAASPGRNAHKYVHFRRFGGLPAQGGSAITIMWGSEVRMSPPPPFSLGGIGNPGSAEVFLRQFGGLARHVDASCVVETRVKRLRGRFGESVSVGGRESPPSGELRYRHRPTPAAVSLRRIPYPPPITLHGIVTLTPARRSYATRSPPIIGRTSPQPNLRTLVLGTVEHWPHVEDGDQIERGSVRGHEVKGSVAPEKMI